MRPIHSCGTMLHDFADRNGRRSDADDLSTGQGIWQPPSDLPVLGWSTGLAQRGQHASRRRGCLFPPPSRGAADVSDEDNDKRVLLDLASPASLLA
jgi:hypothetical protein